jgi:DNA-directed RNA polymerase specialized sigma24 family protein
MRFWLGLSYPEIARQTGLGESRVKASVSRTKKKLAEQLRKEGITV